MTSPVGRVDKALAPHPPVIAREGGCASLIHPTSIHQLSPVEALARRLIPTDSFASAGDRAGGAGLPQGLQQGEALLLQRLAGLEVRIP